MKRRFPPVRTGLLGLVTAVALACGGDSTDPGGKENTPPPAPTHSVQIDARYWDYDDQHGGANTDLEIDVTVLGATTTHEVDGSGRAVLGPYKEGTEIQIDFNDDTDWEMHRAKVDEVAGCYFNSADDTPITLTMDRELAATVETVPRAFPLREYAWSASPKPAVPRVNTDLLFVVGLYENEGIQFDRETASRNIDAYLDVTYAALASKTGMCGDLPIRRPTVFFVDTEEEMQEHVNENGTALENRTVVTPLANNFEGTRRAETAQGVEYFIGNNMRLNRTDSRLLANEGLNFYSLQAEFGAAKDIDPAVSAVCSIRDREGHRLPPSECDYLVPVMTIKDRTVFLPYAGAFPALAQEAGVQLHIDLFEFANQ